MKYGFELIKSDDGLSVTARVVDNLYILCEKEKDTAVFGESTRIATEHGIDTYLTLNEKAIIKAFSKQIPKKAIPHKVAVDKIKIRGVNWGKGTTIYKCPCCDNYISITNKYCHECGQAIDWSDTE